MVMVMNIRFYWGVLLGFIGGFLIALSGCWSRGVFCGVGLNIGFKRALKH